MTKLDVVKLKFETPLHIGNEREDYASGSTLLHSDALTAAIFFTWNRLGHPEWIPKNEHDDPGFIISSLFPYLTIEGKTAYFVPRPMISNRQNEKSTEDTSLRKQLKKIAWIDWDIFNLLREGKQFENKRENIIGAFQSVHNLNPEIVQDKMANNHFIDSDVYPRSKVSRFGKTDTEIFYIERYYFKDNAGLYALVNYQNKEIEKRVQAAFKLLGEEGIGTDRNIGNGKFVPSFGEELRYPEIPGATFGINLGLYCPKDKAEMESLPYDEKTGYDLIKRSGWLSEPYNTWRKRNVYMFKEGSCFKLSKDDLSNMPVTKGALVDVRPSETYPSIEHPIWRSGKSIFIPCK